jgi:hypothetical protein
MQGMKHTINKNHDEKKKILIIDTNQKPAIINYSPDTYNTNSSDQVTH